MIPATTPEMLDQKARRLIETQNLQGFLLSGGSNRRNEIRYGKFFPVIELGGFKLLNCGSSHGMGLPKHDGNHS